MADRASNGSQKAAAAAKRRLTFSFDSSGWLYVYHLGAAHYIQTQLMPNLPEDELSFSGSSGGALVACGVGAGRAGASAQRCGLTRPIEKVT